MLAAAATLAASIPNALGETSYLTLRQYSQGTKVTTLKHIKQVYSLKVDVTRTVPDSVCCSRQFPLLLVAPGGSINNMLMLPREYFVNIGYGFTGEAVTT